MCISCFNRLRPSPSARSPFPGQYGAAGNVPSSWRPRYSSAGNATRGVQDNSANDSSAATAATASAGIPSVPSAPGGPGAPEPAQGASLAVPPSTQVATNFFGSSLINQAHQANPHFWDLGYMDMT